MQAKHSSKSQTFAFVCMLCVIACEGIPSVMHVLLPDESCQCVVTTSDLVQLIAYMNQNVISTNTKLTNLEQFAVRMENKQRLLLEQVQGLKSRLSTMKDFSKNSVEGTSNRDYYPVASRLVDRRENVIPGVDPAMETAGDSKDMKQNLTSLHDEVTMVKNMTLEALQENSNIKQELENEKRVRRSLQTRVYIVEEELNQTQSQVQMINDKVTENDFNSLNSSEEKMIEKMVDEMVLLKFHEFDGLNKTDLENRLKTLEYTVNDVYRNGTFLRERLDNFESMMENGTLVKTVDNVTITLKKFENYEEMINEIEKLRYQVSSLNSSLEEEIKEVSKRVMDFLENDKVELLDTFKGEFLEFNDTWSDRYRSLQERLSSAVERMNSSNLQIERLLNDTEAQGVFANYPYYESSRNFSAFDSELRRLERELSSLMSVVTEIDSFRKSFNINASKTEFQRLSENLIAQNQAMNKKLFLNVSDLIALKSFEIQSLKEKYEHTDSQIKHILSSISSRENNENEQRQELVSQVMDLRKKYDVILDDLGSSKSNFDNYAFRLNESIFSVVEDIAFVRENQLRLDDRVATSLNNMEDLLINEMNNYKKDLGLLNEKQEQILQKMRMVEKYGEPGDETSSMRSRSGGGNVFTKDEIHDEDVPCTIPLPMDSEMIIVDLHQGMVPATEDKISDGHQLSFTCRQIGRFILDGSSTLNCSHGQWSNSFPRCRKLVEETTIREASRSKINPCSEAKGQFPDPTDCTKYYDCWEGIKYLKSCPSGLHFNAEIKRCDYANRANCQLRDRKAELGKLLNIIPPITFDPIQVNGAYSLVATNVNGELVVYPGTNLNLHCLYPRALGEPKWQVAGSPLAMLSAWETQGIEDITEAYKLTLHLTSIAEEYSGSYACVTPSGKTHSIQIIVKGIQCPLLEAETSSPLEISYRPVPDGPERIMTSQALFGCPEGYSLGGLANVTCLASGFWSHPIPQCFSSKNNDMIIDLKPTNRCAKINLIENPGLQVDLDKAFYNPGDVVYFTCGRGFMLVGDAFIRCDKQGKWTSTDLPECISRN